jgi:hypothetical protein
MIAGHFGLAAAVKAQEKQAPLWALMLATVWLDIVFVPLFLSHIETVEPVPGASGYGAGIIHADYTHSLVGAIVLALVFGGVSAWAWGRRTGIVLGLVAFSHWVLDLLVHRMDMPILPGNFGNLPRLGLGLWQFPLVAAGLELLLVVAGAGLYWRALPDRAMRGQVTAGLILVGGVATLALDFTNLLP